MLTTVGAIRRLVREAAFGVYPGRPAGKNELPDDTGREALGSLAQRPHDVVDGDEGMPEHLVEPAVDPKDCYGPVPPDAPVPYVSVDPFAVDTASRPFSGRQSR